MRVVTNFMQDALSSLGLADAWPVQRLCRLRARAKVYCILGSKIKPVLGARLNFDRSVYIFKR